eukprot:s635_g21.t1
MSNSLRLRGASVLMSEASAASCFPSHAIPFTDPQRHVSEPLASKPMLLAVIGSLLSVSVSFSTTTILSDGVLSMCSSLAIGRYRRELLLVVRAFQKMSATRSSGSLTAL